ncbi:hypothetical protein D3C83_113170 [compost metagenome]
MAAIPVDPRVQPAHRVRVQLEATARAAPDLQSLLAEEHAMAESWSRDDDQKRLTRDAAPLEGAAELPGHGDFDGGLEEIVCHESRS